MSMVCRSIVAGLATVLVALNGCGGGGNSTLAGIGGTGKIASGTITGFGSIFVNGVRYDIDNAAIEVNDDDSPGLSQDDLRIGMVVTVTAEVFDTNGDGDDDSGIASQVVYDNEIKGPVSELVDPGNGLTKSFSVLGVNVIVDVIETEFDDSDAQGFSFLTIAEGDVVDISGFFDGANVLNASYIEKTDDFVAGESEIEIKGTPDPGTDAGAGDSFILDGVTVNILADADLREVPGGRVTDAMFVEVEGTLISDNPLTVDAFRIEQEQEGLDDDAGEAELEGFVSDFVDISNFRVDDQLVDASDAEFKPADLDLRLSDGTKVEVEGIIMGGILFAEKVEVEDDSRPGVRSRPGTIPGKPETAPGKPETAAGKPETTPGKSETAPGKPETTPGKSETAPGKPETTPGKPETAPGKPETTPGKGP